MSDTEPQADQAEDQPEDTGTSADTAATNPDHAPDSTDQAEADQEAMDKVAERNKGMEEHTREVQSGKVEEGDNVVPNPSTAPESMQPRTPGPDGVIESDPVEDAPGPEAQAPASGGTGS